MTKIRDQKLANQFGALVKRLRMERGLSQEQVAYDANIPINQVGRIERGEINTTMSTLFAIGKALKLSIIDLLLYYDCTELDLSKFHDYTS